MFLVISQIFLIFPNPLAFGRLFTVFFATFSSFGIFDFPNLPSFSRIIQVFQCFLLFSLIIPFSKFSSSSRVWMFLIFCYFLKFSHAFPNSLLPKGFQDHRMNIQRLVYGLFSHIWTIGMALINFNHQEFAMNNWYIKSFSCRFAYCQPAYELASREYNQRPSKTKSEQRLEAKPPQWQSQHPPEPRKVACLKRTSASFSSPWPLQHRSASSRSRCWLHRRSPSASGSLPMVIFENMPRALAWCSSQYLINQIIWSTSALDVVILTAICCALKLRWYSQTSFEWNLEDYNRGTWANAMAVKLTRRTAQNTFKIYWPLLLRTPFQVTHQNNQKRSENWPGALRPPP